MKPSRIKEKNSAPRSRGEIRKDADPEAHEKPETTSDVLPDIETLDRDSDYRPFLKRTVAPALRRGALRKLWRSDPLFGRLDGLNDYDEDFASLHREGTEILDAARKAGKRLVSGPTSTPEEPESAEEKGADETETEVVETEQDDQQRERTPEERDKGDSV